MFAAEEIIQKKRDGLSLEEPEIDAFVEGVSSGDVSDAQIAAFAMATWFRGMDRSETSRLTLAMRDSGKVMAWPDLDGPVLDKHSTGGVGDLVSLVLGPVLAACGGYVPMISGRGLGHTGGTLDKLESIPGFQTTLGTGPLEKQVREIGIAIVGQSDQLAPADRRIYAVRDVTATVSAPPLMISSILSKKLAEGLNGLVLDIKYGSGAFTPGPEKAMELAGQMSRVAVSAGLPCTALATDMSAPLANSAGNALEVREAIDFLAGRGVNTRLEEVTLALCTELLLLGDLAESGEEAGETVRHSLESGSAAEKFARMVAAQGGPAHIVDRPDAYLPTAYICRPLLSDADGYVSSVDTTAVGNVVVSLGGGRRRAGDRIDPAVGLSDLPVPGSRVEQGQPLVSIHAADEASWLAAAAKLSVLYELSDRPPKPGPVVYGRIEGVSLDEN